MRGWGYERVGIWEGGDKGIWGGRLPGTLGRPFKTL